MADGNCKACAKNGKEIAKCRNCDEFFCYGCMPNNLDGWTGGHNCSAFAPKCQVKTDIFKKCGGQIRNCSNCDFSFCHAHRKPGYNNGHACVIGCETTFFGNCVGKRKDLQECEFCKKAEDKFAYCVYHLLPVETIVSLSDQSGGGGHVCRGFTSGSVFFGNKASDFAGILLDATILVFKQDATPLVRRVAINSLKVLVAELNQKFDFQPKDLQESIGNAANILQSLDTNFKLLNDKVKSVVADEVGEFDRMVILIKKKVSAENLLETCKVVKMMAGNVMYSLRKIYEEMEDSTKGDRKLSKENMNLYNAMLVYVEELFCTPKFLAVTELLKKLDTVLARKNLLSKMIPGEETINDLLPLQIPSEAMKKLGSLIIEDNGTTGPVKIYDDFKLLLACLKRVFDFITKVVTVVEIIYQMKEFVTEVATVIEGNDNAKLHKLFDQGVTMTKTIFTLTGYYDSPSEVSDQCWTAEQLKTDDESAKLQSINIVSPVDGSRLDARREEQMMNDMRQRKYQMVRLERTVEGMQHEIERLKAEAREQREHGTPLTTDNDETWT